MGAATSVYKDELYGDATQTIALCTCYDQLVAMQQSKISLMKYKKEPISDKRFREHLILPANDPHFNSFNKRKVRVRKTKVNALAFTDVMKCAKDKLAKRNLKVTRHRKLVRLEKDQLRKKRVLDACKGSSQLTEEGTSALIAEAMNRLHSRQID
jgi:hypothetical protein